MPGPKRGAIQRARTFVKMLTGWLCRVAPGLWALQRRSAWGEGEHQVDRAPEPTCHVGWRTESGRARSPLAPTTRADRAQTVAPHRLRLPEQRRGQGEEEAPGGGGVGTWDGAGGRGEMVRARNREGASADSHAAAPPVPGPGEARVCCEAPSSQWPRSNWTGPPAGCGPMSPAYVVGTETYKETCHKKYMFKDHKHDVQDPSGCLGRRLDREDGLPGPECCPRTTGRETAVQLSLNVRSLGGVSRPTACCSSCAGRRRRRERPEGPGAWWSASGDSR